MKKLVVIIVALIIIAVIVCVVAFGRNKDSNNNNRGTLSRAQGPPPLKTHVWTSQPQTRDYADWSISVGSGMKCLLLFLCLKLYFITQLFFSIKLSISLWDIAD